MKLILIGFMGSGKSTVAKHLGRLFTLPVVEMDDLVLQRCGAKDTHEIFARGGEPLFRQIELKVAEECATIDNAIISTGGGVIMNDHVMNNLRTFSGKVIFMNVAFEVIAERLCGDTSRPLFNDVAQAKSLYQYRQHLYRRHADHVVEAGNGTANEVAEEIAKLCVNYGK